MRERHLELVMARCLLFAAALLPSLGQVADPVDHLAADPDQLRQIEKRCQSDWSATGDALCAAASKARRERFLRRRISIDPPSTTEVVKPRGYETADPKSNPTTGEAD